MNEQEGITKFDLQFTPSAPLSCESLRELNAWRRIFYLLGLIGQDPSRYGGIGFGNVSRRLELYEYPTRSFVITGTQTGYLSDLDEHGYAVVTDHDLVHNRVIAHGPIAPSSESLTHAMLYRLDDKARFIFHVHSPAIWHQARALAIPTTDAAVRYGTQEMAAEVQRLFADQGTRKPRLFAMGGHEDGVLAYGYTAEEAGQTLLCHLARALALTSL